MLQNTTDFHTNSNPLEDISNPPCCDGCLLFRTFPKVEKRWTGLKYTNVAEGAANEVKKKNKPKINYLLNILLIWCLPCSRSISYKIHFFFLSCFHLHWCIVLLWLKRTILLVLVFHFDYPAVLVFFRAGRLYITCRIFCSMGISSKGGTPFFGPEQGMFFRVLDRNPLKDCKGLI